MRNIVKDNNILHVDEHGVKSMTEITGLVNIQDVVKGTF